MYDHLLNGQQVKVTHPLMPRHRSGEKKNDRINAGLTLRFLPECDMASTPIRVQPVVCPLLSYRAQNMGSR
jgi:hypothetical protein